MTAIFGNGLLTSEGDFWLKQRRLAAPAFHPDRIAAYGDVMAVLVLATIRRRWRPEMAGPDPVPFPSITLRPEGGPVMRVRRRDRAD